MDASIIPELPTPTDPLGDISAPPPAPQPQPPSAQLAATIRHALLPCQSCRALRVKCFGGFPCTRCFDMGSKCMPETTVASASKGKKRAGLAVVSQVSSPMELAYLSSNPLVFADMYTGMCLDLVAGGHCSRESALRMLRNWRRESLRVGADVTIGVGKVLQERMGIDPIELVDQKEVLWGPPDAARRAGLGPEERQQARRQELLQWGPYKRAGLGGAAAYCLVIDAHGRSVHAANPAFSRLVGGAGWPGRHVQACKMLPIFLGASICAPQDRQVFLQAVAENAIGDRSSTRRRTHLLKLYTDDGSGTGRVGLFIMTLENIPLEGGAVGLVMRIEAAPPSRHLTARPAPSGSGSGLGSGSAAASAKRSRTKTCNQIYRRSTLAEAAAAAAAAETAAGPASQAQGVDQQQQSPFICFPAMAAAPGLDPAALQVGAGAAAPAAPQLFGRQVGFAASAAASAAGTGGGEPVGAAEAGPQVDALPPPLAVPSMPPWTVAGECGESVLGMDDAPLSVDSADWFGLVDEGLVLDVDAASAGGGGMGFAGSPIPTEKVFKEGGL